MKSNASKAATSPSKGKLLPVIEEVSLENFMSYEYARIPLKKGLNIICGPNGAGKSSILLAISVALGQAYTERSRKLSDLIRRGKDIARITLTFDNASRGGKRPLPRFHTNKFALSRFLKKDGTYWYEGNFREITKEEVSNLLMEFGLDPNNLLIIMHQGMLEEFVVTTPQQKLRMIEDAVGFRAYRAMILEAQSKLAGLLSEEGATVSLLENAEQTLTHWKEEHERYLRRRELLDKMGFLERELAWSQVIKREKARQVLEDKIQRKTLKLKDVAEAIDSAKAAITKLQQALDTLTLEQRKQFYTLLNLERRKAEAEATSRLLTIAAAKLEGEQELTAGLRTYLEEIKGQIEGSKERVGELEEEVSTTQSNLGKIEKNLGSTTEEYVNERVREATLTFRKEALEEEIADYQREIKGIQRELAEFTKFAGETGPRVETERSPLEVSGELKVTNAYLMSLGEISEDAEKMYKHYSELYTGLKEKLAIVSENRKKALEEIEVRKKTWKTILQDLLDEVNPIYNQILSKADAIGRVRLINFEDIETAGLELAVGFRGAEPAILDAYTQSGGERSVAVMAFLLALQQHIQSPFRAVDEFDIHMDPRNREAIYQVFTSALEGNKDFQQLIITPSPVVAVNEGVHIITVQNVRGISEARTVEEAKQVAQA